MTLYRLSNGFSASVFTICLLSLLGMIRLFLSSPAETTMAQSLGTPKGDSTGNDRHCMRIVLRWSSSTSFSVLISGTTKYVSGWMYFKLFTQAGQTPQASRSEEHTSELQSREKIVCRLLLEKKKHTTTTRMHSGYSSTRYHN